MQVLDPELDPAPLEQDVEEFIRQVSGLRSRCDQLVSLAEIYFFFPFQEDVDVEELRRLLYGGHMHLPSSQTSLMALK